MSFKRKYETMLHILLGHIFEGAFCIFDYNIMKDYFAYLIGTYERAFCIFNKDI